MKNKFTEKQKLAKLLYQELEEIRAAQFKLGRFKLKTPIQKGWVRKFKVREDILRSSDGARYKRILSHVQNAQVSKTTDFSKYNELKLKPIQVYNIKNGRVCFPEFYWDKYFILAADPQTGYFTGVEYKVKKSYFIKNPWVFEIVIEPNFIETLPIIDPALESREKELVNKIEKNKLWPIIDKMIFGRAGYRDEWSLNVIKNKEILKEIEREVRNETIYLNERPDL